MIGGRGVQKLVENIRESLQEGNYTEANFLFGDLMKQLTPLLLGVARAKGTGEDAEDLVAQTYLAVFEALESGKSITSIKSFSGKVLQNKIVDYIRNKTSKKRQPRAFVAATHSSDEVIHTGLNEESSDEDEVDDAQRGMEWSAALEVPDDQANVPFDEWETQSVLNPILNALPEVERKVLLSRHYFNLSVEDTARRLIISPDQVKKYCQNAIKSARLAAEKDGVDFEDII